MQAPPKRPSTGDRDLIVIPEARRPLPRWVIPAMAGAAILALTVGVVAAGAWQRGPLRDRDAALVVASHRAAVAADDARLAAARVTLLEGRVAELRTVLDRSRARTVVVGASRIDLRRQLTDALRALDGAQARIEALTGTTVADGRHIGVLVAVGPAQDPPLVVVDLGRWFTGERARQAAIADGAIMPGEVLPHGGYLRNTTPGWRTVPLDPGAAVTVRGWHHHAGVTSISLDELQRLLRSSRAWAERIRHDPFWVIVAGGRVTALTEQRYP